MIFNLDRLHRQPLPDMPDDMLDRHTEHYESILRKYGYDDRNAGAFRELARYLAIYNGGRSTGLDAAQYAPPKRGLFLYGDKGTGKSFYLKILSGLFGVEYVPVDLLMRHYEKGSAKAFWTVVEEYNRTALIIDDICNEREIKSYGNASPMADLLIDRHRQWEDNGVLTFFSSNVHSRDELNERYGGPVMSRIIGMCDFIQLTGKDRRFER